MESIVRWTESPGPCQYRPDHNCRLEYVLVSALTPDEYMGYLLAGWRRFGHTIFRQTCLGPGSCRPLRIDAARFVPNRSQRRTRTANERVVQLRIGTPAATPEKVALFQRFHAERSQTRGWSTYGRRASAEFTRSFAVNPFPTQEWCYYLDGALVGVGYVDELAGGLSAIYFVRDPRYRGRSLGTWNVLNLLDRASALGLPHVYLGYYVDGCPSLQYKANFRPNEYLDPDVHWRLTGKGEPTR
jgi:arginine-tRNA-protein transferase